MSVQPPNRRDGGHSGLDERLLELLAGRAAGDLTREEAQELDRLLRESGSRDEAEAAGEAMELAAAEAYLAMMNDESTSGTMGGAADGPSASLVARLDRAGASFCAGRAAGHGAVADSPIPIARGVGPADTTSNLERLKRLSMAAVVALIVGVGVYMLLPPKPGPSLAVLKERFEESQPDATILSWGDWAVDGQAPEVAGVTGDLVWSDLRQSGYLEFGGLPRSNADEQYQLWIIDAERGMEQRISGAIFSGDGSKSQVVPIKPGLKVNKAAAFAITIEKKGGTWVSDMKRRVVIAARPTNPG
ncbi:MAG: anti-sigma factor [Phycisphaerales bacterium]|nr:MAG: anti-sigma factor [Phycisphaerales bacterium]